MLKGLLHLGLDQLRHIDKHICRTDPNISGSKSLHSFFGQGAVLCRFDAATTRRATAQPGLSEALECMSFPSKLAGDGAHNSCTTVTQRCTNDIFSRSCMDDTYRVLLWGVMLI